ncbi:MAG: hypothetical protein EAZ57_08680 [Cytophagales bacterium]|nr:MAG: hypothetical protein EAZ67_09490 [Cytophagales bacterium]TAF60100.1 MAG: hypothetical protein EAZ57_08680 [Cytophagales bacterium]
MPELAKPSLLVQAFRLPNTFLIILLFGLAALRTPEQALTELCAHGVGIWLVMLGGYLINDFYDQDTDKLNGRFQNFFLLGLSPLLGLWIYALLNAFGLSILIIKEWLLFGKVDLVGKPSVAVLVVVLLWVYAAYWKRVALVGNILVAALVALSVYWALELTELSLLQKAYYILFAGVLNLMREIVKDLEDLHGDLLTQAYTLPVWLGEVWTVVFVRVLLCGVFFLQVYFWTQDAIWHKDPPRIFYEAIFLVFYFKLFLLLKSQQAQASYVAMSLWIKLLFFWGILGLF